MDKQDLDIILAELGSMKKYFQETAKQIMEAGNNKLYSLDFFALAVINRAIALLNTYGLEIHRLKGS